MIEVEWSSLMSDVTSWLRDLGLEKYADAFSANEIDFRALPKLSEEDLKELGLPIGSRRIVIKALSHKMPQREAVLFTERDKLIYTHNYGTGFPQKESDSSSKTEKSADTKGVADLLGKGNSLFDDHASTVRNTEA